MKSKFFYGYVVVVASFCIQMAAFGIFSAFGVFIHPLQVEFGWSRTTISSVRSLSLLLLGIMAIVTGFLNDRFGPRMVMTICGLFCSVGYLLVSQVNTIWQLYLSYGVMVGIGLSAYDVVLLSTIAAWFVEKRGVMSGITKAGTGLGLLIMPLVATRLIYTHGWRTSYVVLGMLALVFTVSGAQFLRRGPSQIKQLPDGGGRGTIDGFDLSEGGLSLRDTIHTRQFWAICIAFLTILFCSQSIMVHIAPHAIDLGISAEKAAGILSVIGGTSIVGRLAMGNAGDRIGNKWAVIICFLIFTAALSWLQLAEELWMLYLFAIIYGFAHGGFFALISPTIAGMFGIRSQSVILGVVIFVGTLGGIIGPVLAGYLFDITHSYQLDFSILVISSIIGLILTSLLRPINDAGEGESVDRGEDT